MANSRILNRLMKAKKANPVETEDSSSSETEALTRRDFLKVGLGVLTTAATLEIGVVGFMFLRSRSLEGEFGGLIKAGEVDTFPTGSVTEFVDENFYLVRNKEGGFLAIYRRCPHLGCTVNWNSTNEHFICPCHASKFDIYGDFESLPVPRALDIFPVKIDEQMVTVDTSQLVQREDFSPDQLVFQ